MNTTNDLLSVKQAAKHLKKCVATVSRYVKDGLLPAQKIGVSYVIRRADLDAFVPPVVGRPMKWRDPDELTAVRSRPIRGRRGS